MTTGRIVAALGVMSALASGPARGQDISLAEDLATADAFAQVCAEQWPERREQFARIAQARQRCVAAGPADLERALVSSAYRDRRASIVAEMLRMPDEQIRAFCATLVDAGC